MKIFLPSASGIAGNRKPRTDYKALFLDKLQAAGLPDPVPEHKFCARGWRFDWCYPNERIAIEYQGGNFNSGKGGHSSISGLRRDYEKFTAASVMGWRLVLIDAASVVSGRAVEWVRAALGLLSEEQMRAAFATEKKASKKRRRAIKQSQ